jgi:hypothetical protein
VSGDGEGMHQLRVVGAERSSDLHGLHVPIRSGEPPRSWRSQVGVDEAGVSPQVTRLLRSAVAIQVGRRGAQDEARRGQSPRDETGVRRLPDTDRQIEALIDQIHVPVR